MGMSTRVKGIRDLDGKFANMIQVKEACDAAGIDYPQAVKEYFDGYESEDVDYLTTEMEEVDIRDNVQEYTPESSNVWVVSLENLPEGVKAIKFENSY